MYSSGFSNHCTQEAREQRVQRLQSGWRFSQLGLRTLFMAIISKMPRTFLVSLLLAASLAAQEQGKNQGQDKNSSGHKRLWVLRAPGEAVEYNPATFAAMRPVKVPAEAVASPQKFSVNRLGQMLFAAPATLPLAEGDLATEGKAWFWDGHAAITLPLGGTRSAATTGSNLAITESAPVPFLSEDGKHLYWSANQARRLQRDGVDLSTKTTWSILQTDLAGGARQDLASVALPDCSCPTGGCEESCPYGVPWVPDDGVSKFFLLNQVVAAQDQSIYKVSSVYEESAGKWSARLLDPPLRQVLDAVNAGEILEAIPDTGCCGWANQSDDQTLLRLDGQSVTVFDERSEYKNPDYDVSFYTQNGKLSPDRTMVALTIVATAKANAPIQLAQEGQANPEESQRIRKALLDLPAVVVKSAEAKSGDSSPRRIAFLPHATLVGWISAKEILVVEGNLLVAYDVASGARQKSSIYVEGSAHVFLR